MWCQEGGGCGGWPPRPAPDVAGEWLSLAAAWRVQRPPPPPPCLPAAPRPPPTSPARPPAPRVCRRRAAKRTATFLPSGACAFLTATTRRCASCARPSATPPPSTQTHARLSWSRWGGGTQGGALCCVPCALCAVCAYVGGWTGRGGTQSTCCRQRPPRVFCVPASRRWRRRAIAAYLCVPSRGGLVPLSLLLACCK